MNRKLYEAVPLKEWEEQNPGKDFNLFPYEILDEGIHVLVALENHVNNKDLATEIFKHLTTHDAFIGPGCIPLIEEKLNEFLAVEEVDKWISVETPPKHKDLVLCDIGNFVIPATYFDNQSFCGFYYFTTFYKGIILTPYLKVKLKPKHKIEGVIKWQPLPSAPKQDKQK